MNSITKTLFALAAGVLVLSSCDRQKEPVDYVNPYMGNISILLQPTKPTVQLPNSLVRVYPSRADHAADRLAGLPVITTTHRESTAFGIFPFSSEPGLHPHYSYDREKLTPYSYDVVLDEEDIKVSYAPSHQSAIYSFEFLSSEGPSVVLCSKGGELKFEDGAVQGWERLYDTPTKIYLYAVTDCEPAEVKTEKMGRSSFVVLKFPGEASKVTLRYGVSYIDSDQAKANLEREIPGNDVAAVAAQGRKIWNDTLGKIKVTGKDERAKTVFYTSLYRTYERMICMDEGGRYYSPYDGNVHQTGEHKFYNDDWIWDTHIAVHPLRCIIEPEKETDMLESYVTMAKQMDSLWMPTFPEAVGDTRRMNCNHAVISVADALSKGIVNFDVDTAFLACKKGIMEKTLIPWRSNPSGVLDEFYWKNGWFPSLSLGEEETVPEVDVAWERRQPVTVTLGTAFDCWSLAQVAKYLGKNEDYDFFAKRSYDYRNIYNPETKFFHPKDSKGEFIPNLDYGTCGPNGARQYYGENNGWVFRWYEPQNIADLVDLMGGPKEFVKELDRTFSAPLGIGKLEFYRRMPDHTGLVGQFAMGNEPSCHIPYLYCYAGEAWRTQKRIRTLLDTWFRDDYIGMPGDEDGGGMSGFVVFSYLGFYPVTPGLPMYVIGSPVFETAELDLQNGKTFKVVCKNYAPENKYIQSAKLNGETIDRCWFSHEDLMKGGRLELVMGSEPNRQWAAGSVPPSFQM